MIERAPTPMIDDALLHALGEEFRLLRMDQYGIEFHQFVADPEGIRGRVIETIQDELEHRELLPEQETVQQRLDTDAEAEAAERDLLRERPDCECRGNAYCEPLHHHTRFDGRRSMFRGRGGQS